VRDQARAEVRDSANPAGDATRDLALRGRVSAAADHCRNALQMLLALRLLADELGDPPGEPRLPHVSQDIGLLADSLERRLSQAVEQLEGTRLTPSVVERRRPGSLRIGEILDIRDGAAG
jgi:hypothetical protein